MANSKSAQKRILTAERNRIRNTNVKSAVKTAIKKVITAVETKDGNAVELLNSAYKVIDKAAGKKIIHKNTAARRKSRLMKLVNSL